MEAEKRQDINVCRTCEYFRDLNDPKMNSKNRTFILQVEGGVANSILMSRR